MCEVLKEVLEEIVPTPEERAKVGQVVERVVNALREVARSLGIRVEVEVEGSFAKDTWLSGDVDIDVFVLFDPATPLEELRKFGLELAMNAANLLKASWESRYASHPYLTLNVEGYRVDVVPAYRVSTPSQIISPVDRTPFHTEYVRGFLETAPHLKDEVRLLKKFAKGVGVYGAEIKVEGFSGYLIELLVIYYGSFEAVMKGASSWRPYRVVIDIEHHYEGLEEALRRFRDPLVVIDPVDARRNVASPVSLGSMCTFIAAARGFLRNPSLDFFHPPEHRPSKPLDDLCSSRALVAIKTRAPNVSEDVLWGQIKRALRAISNSLERMGFRVYSSSGWASNRELVLLFELEELSLPPLEKHYGPPVYSDHDVRFLKKYLENAIAGPYVEGDKWVVIRERKTRSVEEALTRILATQNIGEHITRSLRKGFEVYVGPQVARASSCESYRRHLAEWLERRCRWLRASGSGS